MCDSRQSLWATPTGNTFSVRLACAILSAVLIRPRRSGRFRFRVFFPRARCRCSSARIENGSAVFAVAEPPSFFSNSSIRRFASCNCRCKVTTRSDQPIGIDASLANILLQLLNIIHSPFITNPSKSCSASFTEWTATLQQSWRHRTAWRHHKAHKQTDAAKIKQDAAEIMSKWDVRRYQGMLTYEREKPYRDMLLKYCTEYADQEICRHNTFAENVVFNNGSGGLEHAIARCPYGRPGVTVNPDTVNEYRNNYYGSSPGLGAKLADKGAADLAAWQKASGLDVGSVWVNPWDKAKLPKWCRKKMAALTEGQFRPYKEIVDLTGGEVRKFNPNRLLLRGRLAESKYLKVVEFEDSGVRGVYFDTEGRRCLALVPRRQRHDGLGAARGAETGRGGEQVVEPAHGEHGQRTDQPVRHR